MRAKVGDIGTQGSYFIFFVDGVVVETEYQHAEERQDKAYDCAKDRCIVIPCELVYLHDVRISPDLHGFKHIHLLCKAWQSGLIGVGYFLYHFGVSAAANYGKQSVIA